MRSLVEYGEWTGNSYDRDNKNIFLAQTQESRKKFYNETYHGASWHNGFFVQIRKDFKEPRYGFNRLTHLPRAQNEVYQPFLVTVDARSHLEILKYRCALFNFENCDALGTVLKIMVETAEQLEGLSRASYVVMQALCLDIPLGELQDVVEVASRGDEIKVDQTLVDQLLDACIRQLKVEDEMITLSDLASLINPVKYELVKKLRAEKVLRTALPENLLELLASRDREFMEEFPYLDMIEKLVDTQQLQDVTKLALIYRVAHRSLESRTYSAKNPEYDAITKKL